MSAPLPVALFSLAALLVVLLVALTTRPRLRTGPVAVPPDLADDTVALARRQRRVLTWALGSGAAAGLYSATVQLGRSDLLGLPILMAPVLAAATVLLVLLLAPAPRLSELDTGAADRPWSFAPWWGFVLPASTAVLLLGYLVLAARNAVPDDAGRMRAYVSTCPSISSGSWASPYPGSFYGVPLAIGTVVVVALAALALARIARRARLGGPETFGVDDAVRAATTRAVVSVASAGVLLPFGAVLMLAGGSTLAEAAHLDGACSAAGLSVAAWAQSLTGLLLVAVGTGMAIAVPVTARTGLRPATQPEEVR
jgi:hypothetical protein